MRVDHGIDLRAAFSVAALILASFATLNAARAQDKTYVMKLGTATINESQHEWCKRFVAMVEKDSGGRIKGEIYPASQLGRFRGRSKACSSARFRAMSDRRSFWRGSTNAMKCCPPLASLPTLRTKFAL